MIDTLNIMKSIRMDLLNMFGGRYSKKELLTDGYKFRVYCIRRDDGSYNLHICSWYKQSELGKVVNYLARCYGIGKKYLVRLDGSNLVYHGLTDDLLMDIYTELMKKGILLCI